MEDVSESVDNYEDNEFDESSDEEVGLKCSNRRYNFREEQPIFCLVPGETGYPSRTSFPSLV